MKIKAFTISISFLLLLSPKMSAADSISSVPSAEKRQNSGPAEWQAANIQKRLIMAAKVNMHQKAGRLFAEIDYEELALRFNNKTFSCIATLDFDGQVSSVSVHQTSGMPDIDQKGIDFIRNAAPFRRQKSGESRTFLIEFPGLNVRPKSSPLESNKSPKAPLGVNLSSCSPGPPLRMTANFKAKPVRDIYRRIAERVDAIGTGPEKLIDQEKVNEKLSAMVGANQFVCKLTLKPSGRLERIEIAQSSGDESNDKRLISFLKGIGSFGPSDDARNLVSYRIQIPKLSITEN